MLGGHFHCPGCPEEGNLAGGLSAPGEVAASRALKAPRGSRSPSSAQLARPAGRARGTGTASAGHGESALRVGAEGPGPADQSV